MIFVAPEECRKRAYVDPLGATVKQGEAANRRSESAQIEPVEGRVNLPNAATMTIPVLVSPIIAAAAPPLPVVPIPLKAASLKAPPLPVVPILAALEALPPNACSPFRTLPGPVQNAPAAAVVIPESGTPFSELDKAVSTGSDEGWVEELAWGGKDTVNAEVASVFDPNLVQTAPTTTPGTATSLARPHISLSPRILSPLATNISANLRAPTMSRPTPVCRSAFSPDYPPGACRPRAKLSDVAWPGASALARQPKFEGCPPMMITVYRWLTTNTQMWCDKWHEIVVSVVDFMTLSQFKVSFFP